MFGLTQPSHGREAGDPGCCRSPRGACSEPQFPHAGWPRRPETQGSRQPWAWGRTGGEARPGPRGRPPWCACAVQACALPRPQAPSIPTAGRWCPRQGPGDSAAAAGPGWGSQRPPRTRTQTRAPRRPPGTADGVTCGSHFPRRLRSGGTPSGSASPTTHRGHAQPSAPGSQGRACAEQDPRSLGHSRGCTSSAPFRMSTRTRGDTTGTRTLKSYRVHHSPAVSTPSWNP